jgi:hypothetical protein
MKAVFSVFLLMLIVISCGEVEEIDYDLPTIEGLTVNNIETSLPIINLSGDEEELRWMFVQPHLKTYVKTDFSYYSENLNIRSEPTTIRIKGAGSVELALKSFEIIFETKRDYGSALFSNSNPENIHAISFLRSFRVRNSGQDFSKTMLKDKAYSQLAINLKLNFVPMHVGNPVQVFLNDAYYGLLNTRSESNISGISGVLDVDPKDLVIYKVDAKNGNIEYNEGDYSLTDDLEEAIDRGKPEELEKLIDISSFIDYVIYEDYIGNTDWPHNNIRMYSHKGEPFKFIFYDSDYAATKTKNPLLPELEYISHDLGKIYRALRKLDNFDKLLTSRQEYLYKRLSPSLFDEIVDTMASEMETDILYQIAKFKEIESPYQWKWNLGKLKRDFEMRDRYIRDKYNL